MKIIDCLVNAIHDAAKFDPNINSRPACILWPDKDRQWEPIIKILQGELPELFVLGNYIPEEKSGPAIWLRCAIAGKIKEIEPHTTPVLYLPGYSRQNLRPVRNCPQPLKQLAELQFRGSFWSQVNNRDWTILAFLQSKQGGLGLDVAQDNDTKNAMVIALQHLLDVNIDLLKNKHLDREFFNLLLSSDPDRELLQWLDQGEVFKKSLDENSWKAFSEICKSQFGYYPDNDGILMGAQLLANHEGPWEKPWKRFCESPHRYPNIPAEIRKCKPPNDTLLWNSGESAQFDGWPQWNDDQENDLRKELIATEKLTSHEARDKLIKLEEQHKDRRSLVWAEFKEAPLAQSLEHLAKIASLTNRGFNAGTLNDMEKLYADFGWEIDCSMLKSLKSIDKEHDYNAVSTAIRVIYLPWLEDSTRYLQSITKEGKYKAAAAESHYQDGDCLLFVDGLRFDLAMLLRNTLNKKGYTIAEEVTWAALPTVTATGKAAVTPVSDKITGLNGNIEFEPVVAATGQRADTSRLRSLMTDDGWTILETGANGDGTGKAWCEFGDIDKEGHERGWKLAKSLNSILSEIKEKITLLFESGWKRVIVVTDHGWILLPGGLPKIELHKSLTENKWGRCSAIKPGVDVKDMYPWFWNSTEFFILAEGISCYISGREYAHGGLSLQECLNLRLIISRSQIKHEKTAIGITNVSWKGLRCVVLIDGDSKGLSLDIREHPGNEASSVVEQVHPFRDDGTSSVVVCDDSMEGKTATIVIIDNEGTLVDQKNTTISGE